MAVNQEWETNCNWMKHDFNLWTIINFFAILNWYLLIMQMQVMVWIITWEVYVDLIYTEDTSKYMTIILKVWWLFPLSTFHWPLDPAPTECLPPVTLKKFLMTWFYPSIKFINLASFKLKLLSNWLMTQCGWIHEYLVNPSPQISSCQLFITCILPMSTTGSLKYPTHLQKFCTFLLIFFKY
jgi:hypothetical protein